MPCPYCDNVGCCEHQPCSHSEGPEVCGVPHRAPFSGAVHDFSVPIRKRLETRKVCGPYYMTPTKPGDSRGFYTESQHCHIACARHGAMFDLRLTYVNNRRNVPWEFYTDPDGSGDTIKPITARLSHSRGFLAGWTFGPQMCAELDLEIHEAEDEAQRAAVSLAENAAEREIQYQIEERERLDAEEAEAAQRAEEVAGLGTEE